MAAIQAPSARPYPDSLNDVVAAPKFHRVLFENERVRVLEVTVPPHAVENTDKVADRFVCVEPKQ